MTFVVIFITENLYSIHHSIYKAQLWEATLVMYITTKFFNCQRLQHCFKRCVRTSTSIQFVYDRVRTILTRTTETDSVRNALRTWLLALVVAYASTH